MLSNFKETLISGSKSIHDKILTDTHLLTKQLFDPGEAYGLLWEDSDNVTYCRECNSEFKIPFLLKHHCRSCAGIFCEACCKFEDMKRKEDSEKGTDAPRRVCSGCRFGETPGEPIKRLIRKQLDKAFRKSNDGRNDALKAIDKKLKKVVSMVEHFGSKKLSKARPPSSQIELKRGSLCDKVSKSAASLPVNGYFELVNKTDRFCCIKVLLPGGDRKFEIPRPSYIAIPPGEAVHGAFDEVADNLEMIVLYDNPNEPDKSKRIIYETRGGKGKSAVVSLCAKVCEFQSVAFFTFPSAGSNVIVKYKGAERVEPRKGNAVGRIGLFNRILGKRFGENTIDLAKKNCIVVTHTDMGNRLQKDISKREQQAKASKQPAAPTTAATSTVPETQQFIERQKSNKIVQETTAPPLISTVTDYSAYDSRLTIDDFELLKVLGKGSFGKVMLVKKKDDQLGTLYAMKTLRKAALLKRNQLAHTTTERTILQTIKCPFLVHLIYAFQTPDKLYMVINYMAGGELFFWLKKDRRFSENRCRLYAAEITLALEALNAANIIYRDLKPENILLDDVGHLRLTDFGLAKGGIMGAGAEGGTKTFCGTPEYLAPEILENKGHGRAVDWWSMGTLLYEMLTGLPPFYDTNVQRMYHRILHDPLKFPKPERQQLSEAARDILRGLLERRVPARLGSNGAEEVKLSAFFAPLDFMRVANRDYVPEFKPPAATSETDVRNFDTEFTSEVAADSVVTTHLSGTMQERSKFDGFTFQEDSRLK